MEILLVNIYSYVLTFSFVQLISITSFNYSVFSVDASAKIIGTPIIILFICPVLDFSGLFSCGN